MVPDPRVAVPRRRETLRKGGWGRTQEHCPGADEGGTDEVAPRDGRLKSERARFCPDQPRSLKSPSHSCHLCSLVPPARVCSFKLYCFFPTFCTAGTSAVFPATFAFSAADSSARMPARIPSRA